MTEQLKTLLKKAFNAGAVYEATLSESCNFENFIKDVENEQLLIHGVVRAEPEKTCKGSLLLGTGCGKCPKCKRERYNPPSF